MNEAKVTFAILAKSSSGKRRILGFAVLAMLVGLRPSEIYDLAKEGDVWNYIRLDAAVLRVEGFGKQSDQRSVDMEPAAVQWLRLINENGWPICYDHEANGRNLRYSNFRAKVLMPNGEGNRFVALRRKVLPLRPRFKARNGSDGK